jgi:AcrR family transcriptional regulator
MTDIAAKADMGKSTLYEYFSSKSELFMAVFEWLKNRYQIRASDITQNGQTAQENLLNLIKDWAGSLEDMDVHYQLIMEFWAATASSEVKDQLKKAFADIYQAYRQLILQVIQKGIDRGELKKNLDAEAVSAGVIGTLDGIFLQAWFKPEMNPCEISTYYLKTLIQGLSSGPSRSLK